MKISFQVLIAFSIAALASRSIAAPPPDLTAVESPLGTPRQIVTINLNWNEKQRDQITIPVANDSDAKLEVTGVQTSGDLFIISFDGKIGAHKSGAVIAAFNSRGDVESQFELLRLLTNRGIVELQVNLVRPVVVSYDYTSISWNVGDELQAKSVVVTVVSGSPALKEAKVPGSRANATVVSLGGGQYRVDITPFSTAKPMSFPVRLKFDSDIPGVPKTISCEIRSDD